MVDYWVANFSTCVKKFLVHDQIVYCSLLYRLFQFFGVTKKFKCRHNLGKAWWLSWFSDFPVDKEENEMLHFFAWRRHFTTMTRILFVFPFISQRGLNNKTPNMHLHNEAKPWRILVLVVKWRHRADGLFSTSHYSSWCACRLPEWSSNTSSL